MARRARRPPPCVGCSARARPTGERHRASSTRSPRSAARSSGLMRRATASRGSRRVVVPPAPPAPSPTAEHRPRPRGVARGESSLALWLRARTTPRLQALHDKGELVVMRDAVVRVRRRGRACRTSDRPRRTRSEGVVCSPNVLQYAKARRLSHRVRERAEESWGDLDGSFVKAQTSSSGLHCRERGRPERRRRPLVLEEGVLPRSARYASLSSSSCTWMGATCRSRIIPPSHSLRRRRRELDRCVRQQIRVTDEYVAVSSPRCARDPGAWMLFTSDHGQALGEGGAFFHRGYQRTSLRDPLLVFPPDEEPRGFYEPRGRAGGGVQSRPDVIHPHGRRRPRPHRSIASISSRVRRRRGARRQRVHARVHRGADAPRAPARRPARALRSCGAR